RKNQPPLRGPGKPRPLDQAHQDEPQPGPQQSPLDKLIPPDAPLPNGADNAPYQPSQPQKSATVQDKIDPIWHRHTHPAKHAPTCLHTTQSLAPQVQQRGGRRPAPKREEKRAQAQPVAVEDKVADEPPGADSQRGAVKEDEGRRTEDEREIHPSFSATCP